MVVRKTKDQKIKSGTYRPDQHKEFVPVTFGRLQAVPDPPAWLNEIGKDYFRDLASILYEAGVLQPSDLHLLALLCGELSRYRSAYMELEKQGQVIKLPNSYMKQSEFVKIAEKAFQGCIELSSRFGLDLAGRVKIPEMMKPPRIEWHKLAPHDGRFWEKHFGHLDNKSIIELATGLKDYANSREKSGHDANYKF